MATTTDNPARAARDPALSTVAWGRLPFLIAGALSLFAGAGAGLARLGWATAPDAVTSLSPDHGPLMVCGFFGTLIALERAVALARPWAYAAPALAALSAVALVMGAPDQVVAIGFALAALALTALSVVVCVRQPALFTASIAIGSCAWTAGNLIWAAGHPVPEAVALWVSFFVFTIAGERLELTRLLPPRKGARPAFLAAGAAILIGAAVPSPILLGVGLLALAIWLGVYDIARRTIRQHGLPQFSAACLLSGYVWLAAAGLLWAASGLATDGFLPGSSNYDAALHAIFVGFVFAMVFGHALIIFPAILRVTIPYHPVLYVPLVLLHLSLAARWIGDLAGADHYRLGGGIGHAAAIVLFLLLIAVRTAAARR
jgi:hypothetical protein